MKNTKQYVALDNATSKVRHLLSIFVGRMFPKSYPHYGFNFGDVSLDALIQIREELANLTPTEAQYLFKSMNLETEYLKYGD